MTRCCPVCRLPAQSGEIILQNSGTTHAVMCVCDRCTSRFSRTPTSTVQASIRRAAARAAEDPHRYLVALFPTAGAAQAAAGLLTHPEHREGAAEAFGWIK